MSLRTEITTAVDSAYSTTMHAAQRGLLVDALERSNALYLDSGGTLCVRGNAIGVVAAIAPAITGLTTRVPQADGSTTYTPAQKELAAAIKALVDAGVLTGVEVHDDVVEGF